MAISYAKGLKKQGLKPRIYKKGTGYRVYSEFTDYEKKTISR